MDLSDALNLGAIIEYIRRAAHGKYPVKGELDTGGLYILGNLNDLKKILEEYDLSTKTISQIDEWINLLNKYNDGDRLREEHSKTLTKDAQIWEDRIFTELQARPVIEANKNGSLNYGKLLDGAAGFFDKSEVWDKLSELAKSDLDDSARCLLVDLSTPSAMIALRSAEDCLRQFYKITLSKKPPVSWKKIIDELEGNVTNKPLLKNLDYIRENLRNVAEHPDKRFTPIEAERLFLLIINTIEEMFENLD